MQKRQEKPTPEAKALSLFLMAHKANSNPHKENAKRINRLWDLVKIDQLTKDEYMVEVNKMLDFYGGYDKVVEDTVYYYVRNKGGWKSQGTDKYNLDAQAVADKIARKKTT